MTISNKKLADVRFDLKKPWHFFATGFGSGLIKPAPGTWGTLLAGVPVYLLLVQLPALYFWVSIAFVCIIGVWFCHKTEQDIGVHDHSSIVWDEVAGYLVTMSIITTPHWVWMLVGFCLFRFFDIVKPFPVKQVDRTLGGGLGVMLDDIVAGLFALVSLYAVQQAYTYYALEQI